MPGNTADTLKKSDMDVMTNSDCARIWGWYGVEIKDSHICINDHDWDSSACMVGTKRIRPSTIVYVFCIIFLFSYVNLITENYKAIKKNTMILRLIVNSIY